MIVWLSGVFLALRAAIRGLISCAYACMRYRGMRVWLSRWRMAVPTYRFVMVGIAYGWPTALGAGIR